MCLQWPFVARGGTLSRRSSGSAITDRSRADLIALSRPYPTYPCKNQHRSHADRSNSPSICLEILCKQDVLVLELCPSIRHEPHDPYSAQRADTRADEEDGLLALERRGEFRLDNGENLGPDGSAGLAHCRRESEAVATAWVRIRKYRANKTRTRTHRIAVGKLSEEMTKLLFPGPTERKH